MAVTVTNGIALISKMAGNNTTWTWIVEVPGNPLQETETGTATGASVNVAFANALDAIKPKIGALPGVLKRVEISCSTTQGTP